MSESTKNSDSQQTIFNRSREMHEKYRGKIETTPKCPVNSIDDFTYWYTPGVAAPSLDINKNKDLSYKYTSRGNTVAIISDGSRVLGLGDIGPEAAMPVMEGKALIFKYFANIDAWPLCIDAHTVDEIVAVVKALAPSFGGINLEDISSPKCFDVLERLQNELEIPVWHDDRQGTATTILAGLINALKLAGKKMSEIKCVLMGAGAANLTVARLITLAGVKSENIIFYDINGALYPGMNTENFHPLKKYWAENTNISRIRGTLKDVLEDADVLIALSAPGPGIIKKEEISVMAEKAIVFTCANPTPEIWPDEAKEAGAFIVATGRSDFPNQLNNALVFPGIFRGVLDSGATSITDEMCIAAAEKLALTAEKQGLTTEHIVPLMTYPDLYKEIAAAVIKEAERSGLSKF